VRELDAVRVQGKTQTVRIYELVGRQGALAKEVSDGSAFSSKRWRLYGRGTSRARSGVSRMSRGVSPDHPRRCTSGRAATVQNPPRDWDGSFTLQSK